MELVPCVQHHVLSIAVTIVLGVALHLQIQALVNLKVLHAVMASTILEKIVMKEVPTDLVHVQLLAQLILATNAHGLAQPLLIQALAKQNVVMDSMIAVKIVT